MAFIYIKKITWNFRRYATFLLSSRARFDPAFVESLSRTRMIIVLLISAIARPRKISSIPVTFDRTRDPLVSHWNFAVETRRKKKKKNDYSRVLERLNIKSNVGSSIPHRIETKFNPRYSEITVGFRQSSGSFEETTMENKRWIRWWSAVW